VHASFGAHEVFADLLTPEGVLGNIKPDDQAQLDITRGQQVLLCLSQADVGQSVIVQLGVVLGVEAIEGTDALINRTASLKREGPGGVLVKIAKAQQDNRFDLPTIGLDTVKACQAAGLRGIAVEAGRSLCLERDAVIAAANAAGIFVIGLKIDKGNANADNQLFFLIAGEASGDLLGSTLIRALKRKILPRVSWVSAVHVCVPKV